MIDIPKEFIEQAKAMEREQIKDAYNRGNTMIDIPKEFIEQAKAMEREQIKDAYNQGESDGYKQFIINIDKTYESFEQYYKETYETI